MIQTVPTIGVSVNHNGFVGGLVRSDLCKWADLPEEVVAAARATDTDP
jgi:hypothetical protein